MPSSDIADPGLASAGAARIEWAEGQMPVLRLDPAPLRARSGRSTA